MSTRWRVLTVGAAVAVSIGALTAADYAVLREQMVHEQLEARDIRDQRVLAAMRSVPRHEFVPEEFRTYAYEDSALPIGQLQTISQPYIVALMTQLADVKQGDRVLEIGTGSGYQAAVLAELTHEVYTIEILEPLATQAEATLRRLGYDRIHGRTGDGYAGWPEAAPFDAILVTAAAPKVPRPLLEQLTVGGRLVIPVGQHEQELKVITKQPAGFAEARVIPVRFVPMKGRIEGQPE